MDHNHTARPTSYGRKLIALREFDFCYLQAAQYLHNLLPGDMAIIKGN
jgi:hypothetical protein